MIRGYAWLGPPRVKAERPRYLNICVILSDWWFHSLILRPSACNAHSLRDISCSAGRYCKPPCPPSTDIARNRRRSRHPTVKHFGELDEGSAA